MPKSLRIEQKPAVIACAESYGVERAAIFHSVPVHLVEKWVREKDKILAGAEKRREEMRAYAQRVYSRKGSTQKASPEARRKWYAKHVFKQLVKTIGRNLRAKGLPPCGVTALDLATIAKRQRCKCALSGEQLTAENISPDHITPISKGGSLERGNIQLVTKRANFAKHTLDQAEFLQMCRAIAFLHPDPAARSRFP